MWKAEAAKIIMHKKLGGLWLSASESPGSEVRNTGKICLTTNSQVVLAWCF